MKSLRRYQLLLLIVFALVLKVASSLTFSPPLTSTLGTSFQQATPTPAPTAAAQPTVLLKGDPIPIKPLAGLTSLNASVDINVNGLMDGKRTNGGLNAQVATNDQKTQITVTGSLLGPIAAQVGGSVVGLFAPKKVDVYKVPEGTYVVVNALVDVCVKPDAPKATAALEQLSPANLMEMLTNPDVARGTFVGDETLNGMPVKHYKIDGASFVAAAQASSDESLRTFGDALWSADDADVFISADGGYPVAFRGNYSGEFEPLKFEGDFGVKIDLTGINQNTPITLPAACNRPISA